MLRFDNARDAVGVKGLEERCGDLLCHALLELEAAREDLHDSGKLAEADDLAVCNIRDMRPGIERQDMMLAHAEEVNVLYDDHLIVLFVKDGAVENLFN